MCGNEPLKCGHKMFINMFIKKILKIFMAPHRMHFIIILILTNNHIECGHQIHITQ
jgi:hypothetical protein